MHRNASKLLYLSPRKFTATGRLIKEIKDRPGKMFRNFITSE